MDYRNIMNFRKADAQVHKAHGFYDVVAPEFDPDFWRLGDLYFDEDSEVFTYSLHEIPVSEVKERLKLDFEHAKDRTRKELLDAIVDKMIELHRDELPRGLVELWDTLVSENNRVSATIDALAEGDPDALRKFRIRGEDIESFATAIKKYKV